MSLRSTTLALGAMLVFAVPASAQGRGPSKVPPGHRPPPGMCRIWLDDVPPGRQPEPTDCATARRWAPDNSRIIYGSAADERRARRRAREVDARRDEQLKRDGDRRRESVLARESEEKREVKRDTGRKSDAVKRDDDKRDPELKRRSDTKRTAVSDRSPRRVKR